MKLIATIIATIALLLGGTVALAAPANAEPCTGVSCEPLPEPCQGVDCPAPPEPCLGGVTCAGVSAHAYDVLEQTANDYRVQVAALTEQVAQQTARANRAERLADRRAATIQRLRAKIRSLR